MNFTSRTHRALFNGALSLSIFALVVGCGGGGDKNPQEATGEGNSFSNETRADLDFSGGGNDFRGKPSNRPEINATTTGIHSAISDAADSKKLHILLIQKPFSYSSEIDTLNITLTSPDRKSALDLPKGRNYDLSLTNTMQISYYERNTRSVSAYLATAGDVQVTRANKDSLTFQFKNVVFRERGDATERIALTLNGPLIVNKGEFVIEPDATFQAHQFGFGPNAK